MVEPDSLEAAFLRIEAPLQTLEGPTTAELLDERDPQSPVVIRDRSGAVRIVMPRADYLEMQKKA